MAEPVRPGERAVGRALIALGVLGVLAGLAVAVVGWWLVGAARDAADVSLALTAQTLETLDASVALSAQTVATLDDGLGDVQRATASAGAALGRGEELLAASAELTGTQLADAVAAADRSLPAVERVAGVIDTTLRALDALPVGPAYDPDQPFDQSIRDLQAALGPVPGELRAQADLLEELSASVGSAGRDAAAIAEDVGAVDASLDEASRLLASYAASGAEAGERVAQARAQARAQAGAARFALVALGLSAALGQVVPLTAGWWVLTGRHRQG